MLINRQLRSFQVPERASGNFLSGIRKIEVLAMLQRSKTLTAEDYQVAVKVDNWYVPILLVETREEAAYDNIT